MSYRRTTTAALFALFAALAPAGVRAEPSAPAKARTSDESFIAWVEGKMANDTTGLRKETKRVVSADASARFLSALERDVGKLVPRDVAPAGGANINETRYLDTGKGVLEDVLGYEIQPPAESISAKIRIRQYVRRDAEGKESKSVLTKGYSFLEIKLPHPTLPAVALKPRVIINNNQIDLLMDKASYADPSTRAVMRAILVADTRNSAEDVDRIMDVFGKLHAQLPGKNLRTWVTTRYVRTAYRIPVADKAGKPVDVQLTIDEELDYFSPKGKWLARYPRSWRTIEIKVPTDVADLSDAQLVRRGLGGLVKVRAAERAILEPGRVEPERIPSGKGKSGLFKVVAPEAHGKLKRTTGWKPARALPAARPAASRAAR